MGAGVVDNHCAVLSSCHLPWWLCDVLRIISIVGCLAMRHALCGVLIGLHVALLCW